ncbi:MAG: bacteriohemerythrin [Spirochaetaceae bacterium]|nr:bacteriohemerythrin [Spirochaetaceae bacterium]
MNDDSVVWDDAYSVGFEAIDSQHKTLVTMINELFESCRKGSAVADVDFLRMVSKAAEYARNHFSEEVKYMQLAAYPNLNEHRKLHDDFVATVSKTLQDAKSGNAVPIEMARFLKQWLLNHIAVADKQYAPYLAKL